MSSLDYTFKTTPYKEQREVLPELLKSPGFALLWLMGTGKTKVMVDEMGILFERGEITGVLVLAPKHIHANWEPEIAIHLPDRIKRFVHVHWTGDEKKKKFTGIRRVLLSPVKDLKILLMAYSTMRTEGGARLAKEFLTSHKTSYILDESTRIKNLKAKITERVVKSGRYAKFRRILSGTPVPNGPFDLYSQMLFLYPNFWEPYGISSFEAYRVQFADEVSMKSINPAFRMSGIKVVKAWRNLDRLYGILKNVSSRVRLEDMVDLPPKVYVSLVFDLQGSQKKAYRQLKTEYMADLDSGSFISSVNALVRLLRLQQITCGHAKDVDDNVVIFKENPRLELLKSLVSTMVDPAIIFARFVQDRLDIMEALGEKACLWDGTVNDENRQIALSEFKSGERQFIVINQQIGGEGLTLTEAVSVIYYSNMFNLDKRLQSEDRAHRIGQTRTVTYYDLQARGTVDLKIVKALKNKMDVASTITGDTLREWIS